MDLLQLEEKELQSLWANDMESYNKRMKDHFKFKAN